MKKILLLLLLCSVILLESCDKKETVTEKVGLSIAAAKDTITIPKIGKLKPKLRLVPEAKNVTDTWSFYNTLSNKIDSLPSPSYGILKPKVEGLMALYGDQEIAEEAEAPVTPPSMLSPAIQARLLALETRIQALYNSTMRNDIEPDDLALKITQTLNAFQDLNLQLNERFAKMPEDLLKDFEEEIRGEKREDPNSILIPSN